MSSAGSPEWHSSQSITAARPDSSTIRLPSRKSPWTRHSRGGGGRGLRRSQRSPTSTAGSGSPISSIVASHSAQAASAGASIEWIRASASPSWAGSAERADSSSSRRSTRGATDVPSTWSITKPALSNRPRAGSNASPLATGTPAAAAVWTTRNSVSRCASESCAPTGSRRSTQRPRSDSARNVSRDAPPGMVDSLSAPGSEPVPSAISSRTPAQSASSAGGVTIEPVPRPVAVRDVRRVLVPVPGARIPVEVLGRVRRIDRIADPPDRKRLVHERAVRAVQGEALATVAPVVRLVGHAEALGPVAVVSPQSLARSARVHGEGELLVVLGDLERPRPRADATGGVRAPGGGEGLGDQLAIALGDLLDRLAPAALERVAPRLLHPLVTQLVLDERDQPGDPVHQQVMHELRLPLHRLAEGLRPLEVAGVDRLDRTLHRRP